MERTEIRRPQLVLYQLISSPIIDDIDFVLHRFASHRSALAFVGARHFPLSSLLTRSALQ